MLKVHSQLLAKLTPKRHPVSVQSPTLCPRPTHTHWGSLAQERKRFPVTQRSCLQPGFLLGPPRWTVAGQGHSPR